jgi:hypothetical protein
MLNEMKIKKVRLLDLVWFSYLTLMMSFVFTGSQQIYTGILFVITFIHILLTKKTKFLKNEYKGLLWYAIFAVYVNISRTWSVYDYNNTGITGWVIYISVAIFCLNYAFSNQNNNIKFFRIVAYAGAVFSVVALITSPLSTYTTDDFSGITGQYRTWIGELSAILLCINFSLYRYHDKKKKYLLFIILNFIVILATGARGSLLLIVIAAIYFTAKERNMRKKIGYIFLGILVVIVVAFIILKNSSLYNAFITRVIGAIINDGSTFSVNERVFFLQSAFDLFKEHPILGCGVDAMRGYLTSIGYWHVTYSHCVYVELLCSYGIIGTSMFFIPTLMALLKKRKSN